MKPLLILLLGASSTLAQTPARVTAATLDESEVRITYGELKRLVSATLPKEKSPEVRPKPPVQAALLSSIYRVAPKTGTIIVEFQIESFDDDWHLIPIAGSGVGLSRSSRRTRESSPAKITSASSSTKLAHKM